MAYFYTEDPERPAFRAPRYTREAGGDDIATQLGRSAMLLSNYTRTPAPTAAIPTAAIPTADYSAFRMTPEEQGRRAAGPAAAKARVEDQAAITRANAYTPAERQMLAISPNPYGTNEPYFDNAGIKRAGYDRMQMNTYDPNKAIGLPGMNPATGIGGSGVGAALQAAAARGDWDAVNRYYASKGQSFAGMPPPGGAMGGYGDLYERAFGPGVKSTKGRERAADFLAKTMGIQAQREVSAGQQQTLRDVEASRAKTQNDIYGRRDLITANIRDAATMQADIANRARYAESYLAETQKPEYIASLRSMTPEQQKKEQERLAGLREFLAQYASGAYSKFFAPPEIEGNADGGLIEGYARGGPIQPVLNPMGNMGMPSSMADLDPAVRQYAQYVSTASQYGLQPVAFPKFIDLLGAARTKLATLPTQGGAVGFAEGGKVEEDNMYYVKQYNEQGDFTGYKAYPRSEMPKDDSGRPYWVPQEEWKKNTPNNNRYADGGMVDWLRGLFAGTPAPAAPPAQTDQQRLGQSAAMLGSGMAGQAAQALQGRNAALEAALQEARSARMGYAGGGAIPVAGQQVFGPGGPKSDSIPAVIDGSRPAALSTGEFVMPTEAVQFFGTDKLNKMIQKARGQ